MKIRSNHYINLLLLVLIISGCSQNVFTKRSDSFNPEITINDISRHIRVLSDDKTEGRFPGSKGSKIAVKYIVNEFKKSGLEPLGQDGFLQNFNFKNAKNDSILIPNIVGIIRGSDETLSKEFIVVGAHFDHLGFGGAHSGSLAMDSKEIHSGADDNASGVSGLIELAGKLVSKKNILRRSIAFVAFNAEEQGIFGSKFFVNNSSINSSNIITMINFDMIGRLKNLNVNISGTGTSTVFNSILDRASAKHYLNISKNPDGYGPSDHASFYANDVPVLFFFTGGHSDYHKPSDTWEKINIEGEKKLLDMAYDVVLKIDELENRPLFTEAGPKKASMSSQRKLKVTFGFMPSYVTQDTGLGVDGVRSDGPAGKAGLKKGDIILQINKIIVKDIYGYMDILGTLKPDQSSTVKILRDGSELIITVNH